MKQFNIPQIDIVNYLSTYLIISISDNQNPLSYALSELLKGQLDLTANFLSTQKRLYANYCASLSTIMQEEPKSADFDKVIHKLKKQIKI